MRILFGCSGIGLLIAGMADGGPIGGFINMPSVLIVLGTAIAFTLSFHTWSDVKDAFSAGFKSEALPPDQARKHVTVMSTARLVTGASGVVGTMIGLVQMLQSLEDPKHVGPAMAVAFLTLLYAVILSEFLLAPMMNRIRLKTLTAEAGEVPLKPAMVSVVTVPLAMITLCSILALFAFK